MILAQKPALPLQLDTRDAVAGVAVDGVAVDGVAVDGVAVDGVAVDGVAVLAIRSIAGCMAGVGVLVDVVDAVVIINLECTVWCYPN